MEQQLLGYEGSLYRLDQAEHIAGRLDRVEVLGVVLGANDRQSQTKWTVKLTWFLNTICGELEQDATEERLLRYTRGYIMQLIGVFYSQMHLTLGCTSGGSPCWKTSMHVVGCRRDRLYWLGCTARCAAPRSMVRATCWGGCVNLLLSWAYHRISLLLPDGFDTRRFPLVESCDVQYRPDNARGEGRLRHYRRVLNGISMLAISFKYLCKPSLLYVEWTPYADPQLEGLVPHEIAEVDHTAAVVCPLLYFSIIEWHQVDRVVREFGGLQHIPTRPLDIDSMHGMDGRFGRGEWFPHLLGGWHELWDHQADHRLHIHHHIDLQLFGQGDQHLIPARVVPEDLPLYHPPAPKLHQPEDGHHLPELRVPTGRGRGRGRGRARGRGRRRRGGGRQQADELQRDRDPVSPLGGGPEGVGAIFRSTIVRLIFRLTGPLNGLSSTVSTDNPQPPKSTTNTANSNK
ncbi:hypothetical protein Ahy_B10g103890 [Arachis hypogaea]|uniref:Aminotransferase-like plant mobile domain-containing protein n=1 Tax=Arachis hypogaea TaxID=3818 RepID=A0A444X4C1_ARAHY|nr:hypothetical protein Ahy_B10g103890 [Arachis hypogaea]